MPQIPYEKNATSSERLKNIVDSTSGGYLAVTGPAGIGKSTLVQEVLSNYPFFVPCYAFLPNGEGNPRDRGEALTFFQDVILRLDSFFVHRSSIGISDVAEGREALRQLMRKANELFAAFAKVKNPKYRMLLILAASTGCRIAELLGLEITDVLDDCTTIRIVQQAKGPQITSQLKTVNSARVVDICPEVAALLKRTSCRANFWTCLSQPPGQAAQSIEHPQPGDSSPT